MSRDDPEDPHGESSVFFGAHPTEHAATKLSVNARHFRKLGLISDQARHSFPQSFCGVIGDKPTEDDDGCRIAGEDEISQRAAASGAGRTKSNAESSEAGSCHTGGTTSTEKCPLCAHPVAFVIDLKQASLGAACSTATCAAGVCPLRGMASSRSSSTLTLNQVDYNGIIICITNAFSQFTLEHRQEISLMDIRLSRGRSVSRSERTATARFHGCDFR